MISITFVLLAPSRKMISTTVVLCLPSRKSDLNHTLESFFGSLCWITFAITYFIFSITRFQSLFFNQVCALFFLKPKKYNHLFLKSRFESHFVNDYFKKMNHKVIEKTTQKK